ncbi:MAG: formyltransferase family protein [Chloroflexi bacterium]|nr:formyltransferase family protein [Chloroflexota bacterium]
MATDDATASRPPLRIGWLSTGRGPGSRGLLAAAHKAIDDGGLNASIDYVLCTRARGEAEGSDLFLDQAESHGLTTVSLSLRDYRQHRAQNPSWRDRYNADLLSVIQDRPVDALVFAGLMLIVSEDIVNAYPTLNLHPALPGGPVGAWQDVIWELIATQAEETGVMVQLSTAEVDRGPVIAWCRFAIRGPEFDSLWDDIAGQSLDTLRQKHGEEHPLFARIRREGLRREALTLVEALRQIADDNVRIGDDRVVTDGNGQPLQNGLDITDRIEALIRES